MSEFIRPRFTQVATYEALLSRSTVEQYATTNDVSLDIAIETLGREYVAKYARYCQTAGTPLEMIANDTK